MMVWTTWGIIKSCSVNCRQNIGLLIANTDDYVATIMSQHFCNTNVYKKMSKEQVQEFMEEEIRIFFRWKTRISRNKKK